MNNPKVHFRIPGAMTAEIYQVALFPEFRFGEKILGYDRQCGWRMVRADLFISGSRPVKGADYLDFLLELENKLGVALDAVRGI